MRQCTGGINYKKIINLELHAQESLGPFLVYLIKKKQKKNIPETRDAPFFRHRWVLRQWSSSSRMLYI